MSDLALVMAGGSGLRMFASGAQLPKPLVPVVGINLLERNVRQVAQNGFKTVVIAIPLGEPRIAEFIDQALRPMSAADGIRLETLVESRPLGNIGAVQVLAERGQDALVIFADNLTDLGLRDLFESHRRSGAALTAATHIHRFQMPYGEVSLHGGTITRYREKPCYDFTVCSAVCALAPRAMAAVSSGETLGLGGLVERLLASGEVVRAYSHQALWIDVNDRVALAEAERLVCDHPGKFGGVSLDAAPGC